MTKILHPAKFSKPILDQLHKLVEPNWLAIDPFAGTGLVHQLPCRTVAIEIEKPWAGMERPTKLCPFDTDGDGGCGRYLCPACGVERMTTNVCGDALALPFADGTFDAFITSPTYGNRYADHHDARDGSTRRSYTHDLRESQGEQYHLHTHNSGLLKWGPAYREFHEAAWAELSRVVDDMGLLNLKDIVSNKEVVEITKWHLGVFRRLGWKRVKTIKVPAQGMRHGENRELRVPHEVIYVLRKSSTF